MEKRARSKREWNNNNKCQKLRANAIREKCREWKRSVSSKNYTHSHMNLYSCDSWVCVLLLQPMLSMSSLLLLFCCCALVFIHSPNLVVSICSLSFSVCVCFWFFFYSLYSAHSHSHSYATMRLLSVTYLQTNLHTLSRTHADICTHTCSFARASVRPTIYEPK